MDNHEAIQGTVTTVLVTLRDSTGAVITSYDGSQPLATTVWPGASMAASCAASTTWVTPALGLVAFTVTAAQSAALAPGRYQVLTTLTDAAGDVLPAYRATLDVAEGPGSAAAPPAYTTYRDLRDHARGWLPQLASRDDGTGFAREQGRARSWLEDCGQAHYRVASMVMVVGDQAFGPRRSGARSPYLDEQFAADTLMVTDRVREALSKKALAYITESVIDGDQTARWSKLAAFYHNQADYLMCCTTLGLDTDGDGYPDIIIDLSATDPMIG